MALPDPPILEHWLLEQPWPVAAALAGVGLVLLFHGWRRRRRGVMIVGGAALLLSAGVLILAAAVTTTRELLITRTQDLIAATTPLDVARLQTFFEPNATLAGPDGGTWLEFDALFEELRKATKRYAVQGQAIRELAAQEQGERLGQTELDLRTTLGGGFGDRPVATRWLFTWAQGPNGQWHVRQVRWLKLNAMDPPMGVWR
jgi:hypothetical protein